MVILRKNTQPLPTHSARETRYYRKRSRYYRKALRYYCSCGRSQVRSCCTRQRAVEPPERYYRAPLRYYRRAGLNWAGKSTD